MACPTGHYILNEEWRLSVNRTEKAELIETLQSTFNASTTVVVTHQVGLTVAESGELRLKMREAGAGFKVTKNRIAKLALKDTRYEDLDSLFTGPTAIGTSQDPVAAAKTLVEFAKSNNKLTIVGGSIDGKVLDKSGVEALAKLPSLDELRGKLVGLLQAPAGKLARVAQAPAGKLARVIKAREDQLQS
jgi:large subunit ribosomal protein L10